MKFFLDSANLNDIEEGLKRGFLTGITTNPSILAKEPKTDFIEHIKKITRLCVEHKQKLPLSVEVFTKDPKKMVPQALEFAEKIGYDNLNIKIPIGWDELEAISQLAKRGLRVNCTCLFTEGQALLAANAGASYVSIFYARLRDIGGAPQTTIRNTRAALDAAKSPAEIIVGSIRQPQDITDSYLAGAHIVTAAPNLIKELTVHPQTTKSVDGFIRDFEAWLK